MHRVKHFAFLHAWNVLYNNIYNRIALPRLIIPPSQLFTGHFRGFTQNSTRWDGQTDSSWPPTVKHGENVWNLLSSPLSLSLTITGEQRVFGLSAELLHCLCWLGQPHGKVRSDFFYCECNQSKYVSRHITVCTVTDLCILPQITQQVGRCGPVAGAVDSVEIILCAHMVESLVRIRCCWLRLQLLVITNCRTDCTAPRGTFVMCGIELFR